MWTFPLIGWLGLLRWVGLGSSAAAALQKLLLLPQKTPQYSSKSCKRRIFCWQA
jgi:hypothetical protein